MPVTMLAPVQPAGNLSRFFGASLAAVVCGAAWLRLQHCYAGLPYLHVWDEPQTASTALRMLKTGDFDPQFFNYGSTMTYLSLLVDVVHALELLGALPGSPEALGTVSEVQINADTGWHWTISHPSFYFWNRVLVAAMGSGTVALTGLLGCRIAGPWAGLAAAAILAGASVPIRESAVITNDAPLAFFVVWAAYQALCFTTGGRLRSLVWSAIAVGLGIGCKYTAGVALIFPWVACWIVSRRGGLSPWAWPLAVGLPVFTFVLSTPYALSNLPLFLNQVGWELRHYHVLGHPGATIAPGWPNLQFQLLEIRACLGPVCVLAVAGLLTLWRREGWVVWLFAVLYGGYMSNTRVNFSRNFLVLYPFIALSAGCAVGWGAERLRGRIRVVGAVVAVGLGLCWLALAVPNALAARLPETRTAVATTLPADRWTRIGIPTELRMHALDLRLLRRKDVRVAPLRELMCGSDREVVVVPVAAQSNTAPLEVLAFNALLPPVEAALHHGRAGAAALWLDEPALNPQIRVVPATPPAFGCEAMLVPPHALEWPAGFELREGVLLAMTGGEVRTPSRSFPAGRWVAHWMLRAETVGEDQAAVRITGGSSSATLSVGPAWAVYLLAVDLTEAGSLVYTLDFINDAMVEGRDRNVEIGGVWIGPPG
ncbi:MAG: phospholipid carrier-dependent glycosyltransferase [Myxococcales bacterium]|nr:phospholipid carrier-dependent glycosyltransferase [Myxococcales bacterium]